MTVFVTNGKIGGVLVGTVTTRELSATVGVPRITLVAPQIPGEAKTVTTVGQEIVGGWLDRKSVVWGKGVDLGGGRLIKQKTVLVPTGKTAGALLVTVTAPQLSATVGGPRATLDRKSVAKGTSADIGGRRIIVGSWLSVTITSCGQVAVLP